MTETILFSGHMTDGPNRPKPRFPASLEPEVSQALRAALEDWSVGPGSTGICGGARGGDLIFAEQCLDLGAAVQLYLPLSMDAFLGASIHVPPALDSEWEARLRQVQAQAALCEFPGPNATPELDPFSQNNLRMAARAQSMPGPLRVLLLWDGQGGDGPGGTADMARWAKGQNAELCVINPNDL